jgi:hypothetical protein
MKYRAGDKVYSINEGEVQEHVVSEVKEVHYLSLIKIENHWRDQNDFYANREEAQEMLDTKCCRIS